MFTPCMTASKVSLEGGTNEERSVALKKGKASEPGHNIAYPLIFQRQIILHVRDGTENKILHVISVHCNNFG